MIYTMLSTLTITLLSLLMKKTIAWIFFANDSAESRCFYQIKRIEVIDMNVSSYKNERWINGSIPQNGINNRIISHCIRPKIHSNIFLFIIMEENCTIICWLKNPGRWLRITVFLVVTSLYTTVYDEIRHENGPYFAVILVTVNRYRIQHRILYRIRSYAYRILITNGRKPPTWIPVKIRCVNGPYMCRICAVFFDQGRIWLTFYNNSTENCSSLRGPPPFPVFLKNGQAKIHKTFRGDRSR
jgi:hypothetical protein